LRGTVNAVVLNGRFLAPNLYPAYLNSKEKSMSSVSSVTSQPQQPAQSTQQPSQVKGGHHHHGGGKPKASAQTSSAQSVANNLQASSTKGPATGSKVNTTA
jgi:hypothetical protein